MDRYRGHYKQGAPTEPLPLTSRCRSCARDALSEVGEFVEPTESPTVLADEPDNRLPACALVAGARVVVTGDRAMLAHGEYRGIRIVLLSTYLA